MLLTFIQNETVTGTAANVANQSLIDTQMYIGVIRGGTANGAQGELDDVLYYTDVLEAAEVKRNYIAGKRSHR